MSYTDTYTQTADECLAAEFVITYNSRGHAIHAADCPRVKRHTRTAAHVGPLRNGAAIAKCCKEHEPRLINLGARVGAW